MNTADLPRLKKSLRRAAERLVRRACIDRPPVDLWRLAALQGIGDVRWEDLGEIDGSLVPTDGGLAVELNRSSPVTRARFTLAHEIAHTFLRNHPRESQFRQRPTKACSGLSPDRTLEEQLCDFAAGELLMPRRLFRQAARPYAHPLDDIPALANKFVASLEATAIRYSRLFPATLLAYWVRRGDALVAKSVQAPWPYVRALKSTPCHITDKTRVVTRAFLGSSRVAGREQIQSPTGPLALELSASAFGNGTRRIVLSSFKPLVQGGVV